MNSLIFLGIDLGTSGVRGSAIDLQGNELASMSIPLPQIQLAADWQHAACNVIGQLCDQVETDAIQAIAIDGTSSSVMLCDGGGEPCSPVLMYNDQSCTEEAEIVSRYAPENSAARSASASLPKVLSLLKSCPDAAHICHQSDWIAGLLCDRFDISDENNCLKLGYDPITRDWPQWLHDLNIDTALLPQVYPPGEGIRTVNGRIADQLGLPHHCRIVAGTTDSIAAFIATGANEIGEAVTSLGSTLVLKLISAKPVFSSELGVYSHRLGDTWLAGGASNSGGSVLLKYFDLERIHEMTPQLDPESPTGLDYYPLPAAGERFPLNDPELQPKLDPRPDDELMFFQGMLEGIATIEACGYQVLTQLGAPAVIKVLTAGGGSNNPGWRKIREQRLGVPVEIAEHSEASYGAALLARRAFD
ncbi:MAG: FGGY-family carbohydrate kinase [Gammaproteobacteria bacterium]|nr:FGGY-family carbohydrate kinase [Gammaproteobacteria bacterium]NNJ97492.1 FGGY-family carbohydrate kinase [Gammaproteobacteria bacterium]